MGRTVEELVEQSRTFLDQYYASIKRLNSDAHEERRSQVLAQISNTGTYQLKETELIFGAKLVSRL